MARGDGTTRDSKSVTMKPTVFLLAGCLLAAGCGREPRARLLLDGDHAPDVLTEQRRLAYPPSLGGNRFLNGWWPWLRDGTLVLSPPARGARMRLEVVHLGGPRPRKLMIDLLEAAPDRTVRVLAAGRDLGAFPLTDPLEVPLPADLPLGRVPIDFQFDDVSHGVLAAGIQPIMPAGTVALRKADVVQSGDSLVDFVRHVAGGETLEGDFAPPRSPRPGQSFELIVEREPDRPDRRFVWSGKESPRQISLPVGDAPGLVRVRLLAHGTGPAGRWARLRLAGGPAREPEPTTVAETRE